MTQFMQFFQGWSRFSMDPRIRTSEGAPPKGAAGAVRTSVRFGVVARPLICPDVLVAHHRHHADQRRRSGEDFIYHPVGVAKICAGLRLDTDTLVAALLHDTVEDTGASLEEVGARFGDEVAQLVDGLTKLADFQGVGDAAIAAFAVAIAGTMARLAAVAAACSAPFSIIGGLLLSQLLTLYTTPVIYLYMERAGERMRDWRAQRAARRDGVPPASTTERPA